MKFKFSIRDILFVILLAAVSAAWIADRNKIAVEREQLGKERIEVVKKQKQLDNQITVNNALNNQREQMYKMSMIGLLERRMKLEQAEAAKWKSNSQFAIF